jgi:hypothetical protein
MAASALLPSELDLGAIRARLDRLERGEWFRWSVALTLPVFLTVGLLVLAMPVGPRGAFDQGQLEIAVRGLLGVVLLYDTFAIYQQVLITRLRRQLTSQLGLIAALDLIKHPGADTEESPPLVPSSGRRLVRCHFSRELRVRTGSETAPQTGVQGRITEISEHRLDAVVPVSLKTGEVVTLEFDADGCPLSIRALVCHSRGLRYGMEFVGLSGQDAEKLRRIRLEQVAANSN